MNIKLIQLAFITINAKRKPTAHKSGFKNVNGRFRVATLASVTFEECDFHVNTENIEYLMRLAAAAAGMRRPTRI